MPPFAVIFDLDGTLVDTAPDLTRATNHVLASEGRRQVAIAEIRAFVGQGARRIDRTRLRGDRGAGAAAGGWSRSTRPSSPITPRTSPSTAGPFPARSSCSTGLTMPGVKLGICTNKLEGLVGQAPGWARGLASFRRHHRCRHDRHSPSPIRHPIAKPWRRLEAGGALGHDRRQRDRHPDRAQRPAFRSSASPSAIRERRVRGIRPRPCGRPFRPCLAGNRRTTCRSLDFRRTAPISPLPRAISSVGRALCSHRRGHWFESSIAHQTRSPIRSMT